MFVNKIGKQHLDYGTNCQDYGLLLPNTLKVVCDGCSEGKHTEVGAKMFCHLAAADFSILEAFQVMERIFAIHTSTGSESENIRDYLCFTVLEVQERKGSFSVSYCGDGYIIKQLTDGSIDFVKLDDGEYPKYYAYNYAESDNLMKYKAGVDIEHLTFQKEEYLNIGVASDGIRFVLDSEYKDEFVEILKSGKEVKMKRFINRHQDLFKDDITIAF